MTDSLLIVFAGAPGTGKSTLARAVARELHAVYLDKGTIKEAAQSLGREMKLEGMADFVAALSYLLLVPLARDNLTVGLPVVIASPAGYPLFQDAIENLIRGTKVNFKLIECITTDEELLQQRMARRAPDPAEQRGRDSDAYQQARARLERLSGPRLVVDTAETHQTNLHKILSYLGTDTEPS